MDYRRICLVTGSTPAFRLRAGRGLALVIALFFCLIGASCAGKLQGTPFPTAHGPIQELSADWLQALPGQSVGELSFHLLDSDGRAVAKWPGVRLVHDSAHSGSPVRSGEQHFELELTGAPPEDLYLYVTYPTDKLSFQGALQGDGWDGQYLLLSVPHRVRDVLVIGMARTAQYRETRAPRDAGALLSLNFMPGAEPLYRSASTVNQDPGSAVGLSINSGPGAGQATLSWDERNLGDYNNNGIVEITDLTPIGLNYQQKVSESAVPGRLELIDGSGDGIVNVQDLTKIGANFQRRIEGFQVYRALGASPAPDDYTLIPGAGDQPPSISRSDVVGAATADELKERLHYRFVDMPGSGEIYSWYVQAFSSDGVADSEGPPSNAVSVEIPAGNAPPIWESTSGLTSATGASGSDGSGALRLGFGRAIDPEGTTVTYKLRYLEGQLPIGSPSTISLDIPAQDVAGEPPYSFLLEGLTRGSTYSLNLQAQDADGVRELNSVILQAKVPMLEQSSDPWAGVGGNDAHSSFSAGSTALEPLAFAWQAELGSTVFSRANEPLISAAGWVLSYEGYTQPVRFDLATGNPLGPLPASACDLGRRPVLLGERVVCSPGQGIELLNVADAQLDAYSVGDFFAAPLLLGDYIFGASQGAGVSAYNAANGELFWNYDPPSEPSFDNHVSIPASDGSFLYVLRVDGLLSKLDLLTGEAVQSRTVANSVGGAGYSSALVLNSERGELYYWDSASTLRVVSTADLSDQGSLSHGGELPATNLLVAGNGPQQLLVAVFGQFTPSVSSSIVAWHAADQSPAWETSVQDEYLDGLAANSSRIFATGSRVLLLDYAGHIRQSLAPPVSGFSNSGPALADDKLLLNLGGSLLCFKPSASNQAPGWPTPDEAGVQSLDDECDSITVNWNSAADADGEPVRYSIYYRELQDPELSAPFTGTTVISDIEDSGTGFNSYTIEGLEDGVRYYIAVRAYSGFWDEAPATDGNTKVLATTTCWNQSTFTLDGGIGELNLPEGEVFAIRGVVEPAAGPQAAHMHLVYNDKTDGHLTHLYQDSAQVWQVEGPGIAAFETGAFEPVWDAQAGRLVIGYADQNFAGLLTRTGADVWSQEPFTNTETVVNPMLSLAIGPGSGDERALVYTEKVSSNLPPDEDYYYLQTTSGVWGAQLELDASNFSGRDLDLLLDPLDSASMWLAQQRGISYAPNRFTPSNGSLYYASGDGLGGFSFALVDSGANAPDSDCGKRVQQQLDPGGQRQLAYYDLNASPDAASGQLKFAYHDGSQWQLEVVLNFDLSFQDLGGGLQYTYSELGFATCLDNGVEKPMIATLGRSSITLDPEEPHYAKVILWIRDGPDNWRYEELSDHLLVFPKDRAPCVLLRGDDGRPNIFVGSGDPTALPLKANWILHFEREA